MGRGIKLIILPFIGLSISYTQVAGIDNGEPVEHIHNATRVFIDWDQDESWTKELGMEWVYRADGYLTEEETVEGRRCSGIIGDYVYFDVVDDYIHWDPSNKVSNNVVICLELCASTDDIGKPIYLEYNTKLSNFTPSDIWYFGQATTPPGPVFWEKVVFLLPVTRFDEKIYDIADFRLVLDPSFGDVYITNVSVARAPGEYVEPITNTFPTTSFTDDDKLLCTYFFYWYDIDIDPTYKNRSHLVVNIGVWVDALKLHPTIPEGVAPKNPDWYPGPDLPEDFSYRYVSWFKREITDMVAAGIDVVLPVYWGNTVRITPDADDPYNKNAIIGLRNLVEAIQELDSEGKKVPKIGMFFDTNSIQAENVLKETGPVDLTEDYHRLIFYKYIRDFYSIIPPEYWFEIDDRPFVQTWIGVPSGDFPTVSDYDTGTFTYVNDKFSGDFGGKNLYFVLEESWYSKHGYNDWNVYADRLYEWVGASAGLRYAQSQITIGSLKGKLGGVASVLPGFDNLGVVIPDHEHELSRESGDLYKRSLKTAVDKTRNCNLIVVETWNEHHESSNISDTQEYGREYIDITKTFSKRFKREPRIAICPFDGAYVGFSKYIKFFPPFSDTKEWEIPDAYEGYNYKGLNVALGDVDGDGHDEVIVGPGPFNGNPTHLRVFDYGNTNPIWDINPVFPNHNNYGLNVACGDIDGDGIDEIITAPGPNPAEGSARFKAYNYGDNTHIDEYAFEDHGGYDNNPNATAFGLNLACGNVDCLWPYDEETGNNGYDEIMDEILVAPGIGSGYSAKVLEFDCDKIAEYNGNPVYSFEKIPHSVDFTGWTLSGFKISSADIWDNNDQYSYGQTYGAPDEIIVGTSDYNSLDYRLWVSKNHNNPGHLIYDITQYPHNDTGLNIDAGNYEYSGYDRYATANETPLNEIVTGEYQTGGSIFGKYKAYKFYEINGIKHPELIYTNPGVFGKYGLDIAIGNMSLYESEPIEDNGPIED
jgi:hypothetical protein